jgi:hypothetical protein
VEKMKKIKIEIVLRKKMKMLMVRISIKTKSMAKKYAKLTQVCKIDRLYRKIFKQINKTYIKMLIKRCKITN